MAPSLEKPGNSASKSASNSPSTALARRRPSPPTRSDPPHSPSARLTLVEQALLAGTPVDQIARDLARLPSSERPEDCSLATIEQDVQFIRTAWRQRTSSTGFQDRLAGDVARLDQMERAWLPLALTGDRDASERVLAIHRQRHALMQAAQNRQTLLEEARQQILTEDPPEVRIVVTYVDDWRNA